MPRPHVLPRALAAGVAFAALVAPACDQPQPVAVPTAHAAPTSSQEPSLTPLRAALGRPVLTALGNSLTLHSLGNAISMPGRFPDPPAGFRFVAADLEGCAGASPHGGTAHLGPVGFAVQYPGGFSSPDRAVALLPALADEELSPGECERGWVTFLVPADRSASAVLAANGGRPITWELP